MSDQSRGTEPGPASRVRAASVSLREGAAPIDESALMDSANQSLADALRITFRILQVVMAVLAGVYVLSGLHSIKTNERGISLLFGRAVASDLPAGFRFAPPYPIGELVKVDTGNNEVTILRAFWPYVDPGKEETTTLEQLRGTSRLDPSQDGSVLTAGGNIAHTQWKAQYRRTNPTLWAKNTYAPHERELVIAAVQRGVVRALAEVTIDDLLTQGVSEEGSVARRARAHAQECLDAFGGEGLGIEIEQLSLAAKIPPVYLRDRFNGVLEADSIASKAREDARREAGTRMNATAGGAAPLLVALIDRHEALRAKGDPDADKVLEQIDAVFDGVEVEFDGRVHAEPVTGEVASMIASARQYRTSVVSRARADLAVYRAKLEQYQVNPEVMVTNAWTEAVGSFFSHPDVRVFLNPPGSNIIELVLNKDPAIEKEMEARAREDANEAARKQREENAQRDRHSTQEGLQQIPD